MILNFIKLMCVAAVVGGCSIDHRHLDGAQKIICVTAPIGSVISDDVYVSKIHGPLYVRCPLNMVPVIADAKGGGSSSGGGSNPKEVASKEVPEFSTAGNGFSGAGIPSEFSVAGGNKSKAVKDGVTTNSDDAIKLVKDVMGEIESLKNKELPK